MTDHETASRTMSDDATMAGRPETSMHRLSPAGRDREAVLREHFASFWATASGEPRAIYGRFIAACPLADTASVQPIRTDDVSAWWVRPASSAAGQAILFIHGGGYVQGSAESYRGFASQIVARAGVPALVIDYPLAPETSLPDAPTAALKAWRFLVDQGFSQIAIVGDSAGGGLSLVTLTQLTAQPLGPAPIAGVVFSPWADLAFTGPSMVDPAIVDPLIGYDYLKDCAAKYVGSFAPADPLASPLHGDLAGLPPLLIQVGTDERLFDDSRQFASKAAAAGVPVEFEIWEGMHHVFQLDVAHLESSRAALDHAAAFLRRHFNS